MPQDMWHSQKKKKKRERENIHMCVYLCINVDVYGNVGINSFMCVCLHVCVCCGNRTGKGYLFRAHNSKGVNHHHLHLVETQKQAEEWERFLVEKSLQVCPDWRLLFWGGCWGRRLTRRGLLCDWIRVHIWPSLIGPKLEKEDSPICPFSLSQGLNVMMTFFFFFLSHSSRDIVMASGDMTKRRDFSTHMKRRYFLKIV